MTREEAEAIKKKVNDLCGYWASSKDAAPNSLKAVNWADLSVRDVMIEKSLLHDDEQTIVVHVEEAHPECSSFFTDALGMDGVEVRCEW